MRTARMTMGGGASVIQEALDGEPTSLTEWGVLAWHWKCDNDVEVEGIAVEWEIDGDDAHVTVLMCDEHAARFAVHPISGNVNWED